MRQASGPSLAVRVALIGGVLAGWALMLAGVTARDVLVSALVALLLIIAVVRLVRIWRP